MTFDLAPYRDLYPWNGHRLDVGAGVQMHYLDEGRGEPVLMLHGNPTWSFFWRHLVAELSGTHRVIVPDHVGCGLSDKPGEDRYDYVLERRVQDIETLVSKLDLGDRITLVVHDWGGMIGLAWAMRNLSRVKRLVVMNTAGFGLPPGKSLPWQIALVRHLPFKVPVRGLNAFAVGATYTCSTVPGRMTPRVRQAYLAPYDSWANRVAVHRFVTDIPLAEGDRSFPIVQSVSSRIEELAKIPVLICWGEKDFVFDRHFLAEWQRRLPSAEVHTFPEAGHYLLEDAHEKIVPVVRGFLEQHPLTRAQS